jgi:hypothetical protein
MRSMTEENIMGAKATQVAAKSRIVSGTAIHQAPSVPNLPYELRRLDARHSSDIFKKKILQLIHFRIFRLVTLGDERALTREGQRGARPTQ